MSKTLTRIQTQETKESTSWKELASRSS